MNEQPADEPTLHVLVGGLVQGVGFRFFVIQHARRLGLAGHVRNLPDGRVEIRARGPRASLEALMLQLRQGPRFSRVEDLEIHWGGPCPETAGFDAGF
jgi:acylphosphatase